MNTKDALQIHIGDCRQVLAGMTPESVNCCVTSPPYWGLRDYGHEKQIGTETLISDYVASMVEVFGAALDAGVKPAFSGKIGRNKMCPCGSGKKFKKCCLKK